MSKISEQKIKELGYFKDSLNRAEYTANDLFNACVECYDQAMQDFLEKACEWWSTMPDDTYGFNPCKIYVEKFKNHMQNEI